MSTEPTASPSRASASIEQGNSPSFQQQITALEQQILELKNTTSGDFEPTRAIDDCLAGIARLSNAIKDASQFLAAYDQRSYSSSIKTLGEILQDIRSSFAPKRKFAFKNKQQAVPTQSKDDDSKSDHCIRPPGTTQKRISYDAESDDLTKPKTAIAQEQIHEKAQNSTSSILASPSADSIFTITERRGEYVKGQTLAPLTGPLSASLTVVKSCVINIDHQSAQSSPFAKLHTHDAYHSLFICGSISGSAFISECARCIIVITCGQLRLLNCRECIFYLHCASKPVIEGCTKIKFAPLPDFFVSRICTPFSADFGTRLVYPSVQNMLKLTLIKADNKARSQNLWDQVEDFMWLRPEPSPNWQALPLEETIPNKLWQKAANETQGIQILDDLLKATQA